MKKLRIIIETNISTWTTEQIAAYQQMLWQLLAGNDNTMVGDTQTWVFEKSEEKQ